MKTYGFIPSPNIHEFKIEIPFIRYTDQKIYTFKPLVILDSYLGSKGSDVIFGLNTLYSKKNKF